MNGRDIYRAALAQMGEPLTSEADYEEDVVLGKLNIMLPNLFVVNNLMRETRGKERMESIPVLTSLDAEQIGYEDEIERTVLPFGLAAILLLDDEEDNKAAFCNNKYYESIRELQCVPKRAIEDVY